MNTTHAAARACLRGRLQDGGLGLRHLLLLQQRAPRGGERKAVCRSGLHFEQMVRALGRNGGAMPALQACESARAREHGWDGIAGPGSLGGGPRSKRDSGLEGTACERAPPGSKSLPTLCTSVVFAAAVIFSLWLSRYFSMSLARTGYLSTVARLAVCLHLRLPLVEHRASPPAWPACPCAIPGRKFHSRRSPARTRLDTGPAGCNSTRMERGLPACASARAPATRKGWVQGASVHHGPRGTPDRSDIAPWTLSSRRWSSLWTRRLRSTPGQSA